MPIRSPLRPDPNGSYHSVSILPDLPSSHDIYQHPPDPLVTIGQGVYPEDSFSFPPSGHNTLSSKIRILNNEVAAASLGYHRDPAPNPVFSEEATIPDSLISHHSHYNHPSDFEHDLPELISRPNGSDEDSWDNSPPNDQRNVWLHGLLPLPTGPAFTPFERHQYHNHE
jgi:hypothetical protein